MAYIFLLRFHEWLTAAAVAFMLTYASTSATHGLFISLQPSVGHDLGHLAVFSIVLVAGVAGIVFALWSPRVLKKDATPLFSIWSIFMAFSYGCLYMNAPRWVFN
jgi:hypothetical protein